MALFNYITVPDTITLNVSTENIPSLTDIASGAHFNEGFSIPTDEATTLFGNFGLWGLFSCAITVAIFILLWWICKRISRRFRDISLRFFFVFVWILGFIVYDIGTCTGERFSLFTNAPMAALHSLGMFLLDSDVSAIHEPYHESWLYMCLFSIVHSLAAVVSFLFIIKHFGYNILAKLKLRCVSCFCKKWEETYVFWGLNEATYRLINSIKGKLGKDNKKYRIIVVRTNKGGDDTPERRAGINRVFEFLSLRDSELERLQELKCLSTGTYADFSTTNPATRSPEPTDILGKQLSLRALRRILNKKTSKRIHMLFLSDNENENLHDAALLLGDKTINDFADRITPAKNDEPEQDDATKTAVSDGNRVIFYCHARYNSVHRVVEDVNSTNNITVRVIDSSHINVEMLKKTKETLPVSYVNVNKDATVSSALKALVVGFSEVGQDSVRFLYEFGAFVKSNDTVDSASADEHVERSEFHMHVVDRQMSDLAGTFVANAPAINPAMPFIDKTENKDALITLHKMDCRSVEFYQNLEAWIKDGLNYIVLATDDDELNISLGVRIFKMAVRYRDNLDNICILVRAHNDDDGHIRNIALHYNRLWAAQKAAKKDSLNQTKFLRDSPALLPIYLFGLDKDVYTYENIIDDSLEQKAIKYKEKYESSTNPEHNSTEVAGERAWDMQINDLMQLGKHSSTGIDLKAYYPTYGGLMKLRRTQGQDFANSLHQQTKELLAAKALEKLGIPNFAWDNLTREDKQTTYQLKNKSSVNSDIVRILNVLAQTEHLRWNASHEILGYKHAEKTDVEYTNLGYKDEVRLVHNCIRDWQGLDNEKKSYDYNVVDITLGILVPPKPLEEEKKKSESN